MVRYILQAAFESKQNASEPIDDLDEAFQPSTQLSTQSSAMAGAQERKRDSFLEGDGEIIEHDEAHGVFRSPRPSITLQELQERESRKDSGGGDNEEASARGSAMRGGIFGGRPLSDLWRAQEMDVGGDPRLFGGSAALDAEAHDTWDEAASDKYDWMYEVVFSDSEAEDAVSDDLKTEDSEEASSDGGISEA